MGKPQSSLIKDKRKLLNKAFVNPKDYYFPCPRIHKQACIINNVCVNKKTLQCKGCFLNRRVYGDKVRKNA